MSQKIICFYHKHCKDGTAAAALIKKAYPEAEAFPLGFATTDSDLAVALPSLSFKPKVIYVDTTQALEQVLALGCLVEIFDHHQSEYEMVKALQNTYPELIYHFDNTESATSLIYKHFALEGVNKDLVAYVRDIDLYENKLQPESGYANQYLSMFKNQPEEMLVVLQSNPALVIEKGKLLNQYAEIQINNFLETPGLRLRIGEYKVLVFNITEHQSEVGNRLSEMYGEVVGLYTIFGNLVRFSFRSKAGCSPTAVTIAREIGGGGHEHASGANLSLDKFMANLEKDI